MMQKFGKLSIMVILCMMILAACSSAVAEDTTHLHVVATNYPLAELSNNVFAGHADIQYLNAQGEMNYTISEEDMNMVLSCDLLIAIGNEEWIAELPDSIPIVRAMDYVELLDVNGSVYDQSIAGTIFDACIWTTPINHALIGLAISDAVTVLDPDHSDSFYDNAEAYMAGLLELDDKLRAMMADSVGKAIYAADGCSMAYFAREYGLIYAPDAEDAIELDSTFSYDESTFIERMIANAEKL